MDAFARFFDAISERNVSKIYLDGLAACANEFFCLLFVRLTGFFSLRDGENMVHFKKISHKKLSECNLSCNLVCVIHFKRLDRSRWPRRFRNHNPVSRGFCRMKNDSPKFHTFNSSVWWAWAFFVFINCLSDRLYAFMETPNFNMAT